MNTILFDLDGTLLPMDAQEFEKTYFGLLSKNFLDLHSPKEFVSIVWTATKEMVLNTELKTNETVFLEAMQKQVNSNNIKEYHDRFLKFYHHEFDFVQSAVKPTIIIPEVIQLLKKKGYTLVVATNPMFPKVAIEKRIRWAGLHVEDFEYVTSFEKNHYCKPQVEFYEEICQMISKQPHECLMVGNDTLEDLVASTIGMKTYLIDDFAIVRPNAIDPTYRGSYQDFLSFVQALPEVTG